MAALTSKERVARKWLTGERPEGYRPLANMIDAGSRLLSYGGHFPLAIKDGGTGDGSVLVNVSRYQVGKWPVSGKPKYSRVTADQQSALARQLDATGYIQTRHTEKFGQWQYVLYVKVT